MGDSRGLRLGAVLAALAAAALLGITVIGVTSGAWTDLLFTERVVVIAGLVVASVATLQSRAGLAALAVFATAAVPQPLVYFVAWFRHYGSYEMDMPSSVVLGAMGAACACAAAVLAGVALWRGLERGEWPRGRQAWIVSLSAIAAVAYLLPVYSVTISDEGDVGVSEIGRLSTFLGTGRWAALLPAAAIVAAGVLAARSRRAVALGLTIGSAAVVATTLVIAVTVVRAAAGESFLSLFGAQLYPGNVEARYTLAFWVCAVAAASLPIVAGFSAPANGSDPPLVAPMARSIETETRPTEAATHALGTPPRIGQVGAMLGFVGALGLAVIALTARPWEITLSGGSQVLLLAARLLIAAIAAWALARPAALPAFAIAGWSFVSYVIIEFFADPISDIDEAGGWPHSMSHMAFLAALVCIGAVLATVALAIEPRQRTGPANRRPLWQGYVVLASLLVIATPALTLVQVDNYYVEGQDHVRAFALIGWAEVAVLVVAGVVVVFFAARTGREWLAGVIGGVAAVALVNVLDTLAVWAAMGELNIPNTPIGRAGDSDVGFWLSILVVAMLGVAFVRTVLSDRAGRAEHGATTEASSRH